MGRQGAGQPGGAVSHALEHAAIVVACFVALVMLGLFVLAVAAHRRDGRPAMPWIAGAFAVFAAKNIALAVALTVHFGPHELVELAASLLDLVVAGLLVAPFLVKR